MGAAKPNLWRTKISYSVTVNYNEIILVYCKYYSNNSLFFANGLVTPTIGVRQYLRLDCENVL